MIGVSDHFVNAVREALRSRDASGIKPILGMDNHFCSLVDGREDKTQFKLMFPIQVDQKQVFIYLKIS